MSRYAALTYTYYIFYNSSVIVKYSKNKISKIWISVKFMTLQTCSPRLYKPKYFFNFSILFYNYY